MTVNTLYIIQFDNYYDRTVHPYFSELEDGGLGYYLEFDTAVFTDINFNPADGVNTTILLNLDTIQFGNYLIVVDQDNEIVSRWFIIDTVRTRGGQYQLNLHRDVITDYWNIIKQSPALIEKCNLSFENPLIFNNEDMTVNQIKTSETLLKDKSGCPWLIAYIAKDASGDGLSGTAKIGSDINSSAIAINESIEDWEQTHKKFYGDYKSIEYQIYTTNMGDDSYWSMNANSGDTKLTKYGDNTSNKNTTLSVVSYFGGNNSIYKSLKKGFNAVGGKDALKSSVPAYTPDRHTQAEVEEFLNLNGKVIRDIDGRYFEVQIKEVKSEAKSYPVQAGNLYNQLSTMIKNSKHEVFGIDAVVWNNNPNTYSFRVGATYNTYETTLTQLYNAEITYTISQQRVSTEDAAYDILAIPYGTILAETPNDDIQTRAEVGIGVIQAIAKNLDASCYDIQLVPYCPMQSYIIEDGVINTAKNSGLASYIMQGEIKVGVIYHVPNANFTFDLVESVACADNAIQRKINNDCDKWRLCSPNYSNYFDFNVEKNNGIDYFNVDCSYKPYNPYIHVNPNFNNLYGQDFDDPRGLVCGGDFSLSQVRDAWESYQLQNKNFQETFDRQIQNMEFNNKYQRLSEIVNASVGTVSGMVSGAGTGLIASGGNPYAAAGGGLVGGIASGIGGIADLTINDKLRNEALDYTKDLFGYQLGNIQAIPLTLSKVSAFNKNNKIFPVLEYYTCTDVEKAAYAQKIAFNGMTNMTIDTIENSMQGLDWEYKANDDSLIIKSRNYIKAKLIHPKVENASYQVASSIADEVYKGFYIVDEE